ncbi:MAG: polysaccharide biosynthesis tyrosine autokinase [Kiritimatiellae bacterium]|nr:polysaccharide biosynthesis tyrosine autokinase [Kiritimatiellia bacterium]MDD4736360.1 polysaccharide biosynthesis tyrosine autokinase [Kiritimatiellia bacterium]
METKQEESGLHFLDYWRVISTRKEIVLAVTLLVILTGTGVTFMLPKKYQAETTVLVRQDALDVEVFDRQFVSDYNPYFLRTQFETIKSKPILYKVIQNLDLQETWSEEAGRELTRDEVYRTLLHGMLNIDQHRDTSLIAIRVVSKDKNEAARIANEVALVYREYRLSMKKREVLRAVDALKNELQKQQENVEVAANALEDIRKEVGVNMLQQGLRVDKIRLQQLEGDRISARVSMLVRKARLEQVESLTPDELMHAAPYIVQNPNLAAIRNQLMDSEVSIELMQENYGEKHPEVRRVMAARDELKQQLSATLDGMKKGLRVDYEMALQEYTALDEELKLAQAVDIKSEREKVLPFERAQRNFEVQTTILDALRARVVQQGIEMEVPRTPVEIIEPAEPPLQHFSPNVVMNIALSVVLGLVAGIGLAYFIEYLDTSVKTVDDVERYLDQPVLGIIPQKVKPLIEEGPDSPHAEAYRVLRTNMQFANKGISKGAFAVVSGGVGEGKSTTLFNLAFVAAQQGSKVLIVDSDLRRPVQHKIMGVSNEFGLTNVLMRDVSVDKAVKTTDIPNLFFLPSGRLPRASMGMLDSQKMKELVTTLKQRYDCIFFDSPPIMGVSDAAILASEVDGVLLVVQYRKYPKMISSRAKRLVENVGGKILGVVLNNINILRDDYYYYYHSYYSHYYNSKDNQVKELPRKPESKTS